MVNFFRREIGIKWKIFFYLLLFSAVILLLLWLFQVVFLHSFYKNIKMRSIEMASRTLLGCLDREDFSDIADRTAYNESLCVLLYRMDENDKLTELYSAENEKNCVIHLIGMPDRLRLYRDTVNNGGKSMQRFRFSMKDGIFYSTFDQDSEDIEGEESLVCCYVTQNQFGQTLFLLLNSVITPMDSTVATLYSLLRLLSLVIVVLAIVLAFLIARSIAKPIVLLNQRMKILATGNYHVDFHTDGYREISELSATMDYAAQELSKVDTLRRELISNISHDLRTPLTTIIGYAEVMRDIPGENTPENLQVVIDETSRLSSLVSDVMDITKLESGVQTCIPVDFSLTSAIRDGMLRYDKLRSKDGYHITFEAKEDVMVHTDRTRVLQVIYNMVNNAVNYAGDDRCVIVRQIYDPAAGTVRISVTDHGIGIPADQLPLIWDRYYKVDQVHRRTTVGTGLGLSIVRKTMELLGGRYGVTSQPGAGSTFWIELPALPRQNPEEPTARKA